MFSLDRSSRKCECPNCHRRSYVLYLNRDTGQPLSPDVGRCDRQVKCSHHYPPAAYFRDHPKTPKTGTHQYEYKSKLCTQVRKGAVYVEPGYINPETVMKTMTRTSENSLSCYLHQHFDTLITSEQVDRVISMMGVGTSTMYNGSPVFWQVDRNGNVRTGKIMGYNPKTGKRIKKPRPLFQWVHARMRLVGEFNMKQCYFGSHLVRDDKRPVWLFESEKAALIVALTLEWLGGAELAHPIACGGCGALNPTDDKKRDPYDGISVLRDREVVLFPDEGNYDDWKLKATRLVGFSSKVYVSTVMESLHPKQIKCERKEGECIDDLIMRMLEAVDAQPDAQTIRSTGLDIADMLLTSYSFHDRIGACRH